MNRTKFAIIENILTIAQKAHSKTNIMQQAKMNYAQSIRYLDFLLQLKLLKVENRKKQTYFITTTKGFLILNKINNFLNILDPKVDGLGNEYNEHNFLCVR